MSDFDSYVVSLREKINKPGEPNAIAKWTVSNDVSKQLELKRSSMKAKHAGAEIYLTLVICILMGMSSIQLVDAVLVLILVALTLWAHWVSFRTYIAEFLPYYVAEQTLLGKEVEFSKGAEE